MGSEKADERLKVFKVTELPNVLEPNAIYMIPYGQSFVEVYVTTSSSNPVARRVINYNDILGMINNAIASFHNILIVENINARNALNPTRPVVVLVLDASADPTVNSGAATYIYNLQEQSWVKITEWESLDIQLTWGNIQGKPLSSPQDIDDAVMKRHEHYNLAILQRFTEISGDLYMYDQNSNAVPVVRWKATDW